MAEKDIVIPALNLKGMLVTIKGETPLLVNRFSERSIESIEDKQQKKAKAPKSAREPEREFMDACHRLPDGAFAFPCAGIKKSLVAAGGRFGDEKMTRLRGALNIMGDLLPIIGPEPTMRTDTIRLQSGVTSIAYRPAFFPWALHVPVRYNASILEEAQILYLFQLAGFSIGIGAWRPENNGSFGQFALDENSAVAAE